MAKKRRQQPPTTHENKEAALTISDTLDEDIVHQLHEKKKSLLVDEAKREQQRQEQRKHEMKEREKNKSFEQLLAEYGDEGSKY